MFSLLDLLDHGLAMAVLLPRPRQSQFCLSALRVGLNFCHVPIPHALSLQLQALGQLWLLP